MDPFIRKYRNDDYNTIVVEKVDEVNTSNINEMFNILQMNIRSIQMNFEEFQVYLEGISISFDIIILTETFVVDDINLFILNGYRYVYNEGRYNRNDGTIVYVRENINFEHENIQLGEITAIDLNIQNNNERIRLTAIYKSPKYVITDFNEKLALYLEDKKHCKKHIITGDINIDLLENEHRVEEYKNILNFFGFTSYINKYTRPESESCLDHFSVEGFQQGESDIKGIVLHNLITDHYPILLSVDLKIKRKNVILKNEKKTQITLN